MTRCTDDHPCEICELASELIESRNETAAALSDRDSLTKALREIGNRPCAIFPVPEPRRKPGGGFTYPTNCKTQRNKTPCSPCKARMALLAVGGGLGCEEEAEARSSPRPASGNRVLGPLEAAGATGPLSSQPNPSTEAVGGGQADSEAGT